MWFSTENTPHDAYVNRQISWWAIADDAIIAIVVVCFLKCIV